MLSGEGVPSLNSQKFPSEEPKEGNNESKMTKTKNGDISLLTQLFRTFELELLLYDVWR